MEICKGYDQKKIDTLVKCSSSVSCSLTTPGAIQLRSSRHPWAGTFQSICRQFGSTDPSVSGWAPMNVLCGILINGFFVRGQYNYWLLRVFLRQTARICSTEFRQESNMYAIVIHRKDRSTEGLQKTR